MHTHRRWMLATVLPVVLAGAGCSRTFTHSGNQTYCGVKIATGAMQHEWQPLDPQIAAPLPAAPSTSELPPPHTVTFLSGSTFVKISGNCHHGGVVAVEPPGNATLSFVIRAKDGTITALGLEDYKATVTLGAWIDGKYAGGLVVTPLSRAYPSASTVS